MLAAAKARVLCAHRVCALTVNANFYSERKQISPLTYSRLRERASLFDFSERQEDRKLAHVSLYFNPTGEPEEDRASARAFSRHVAFARDRDWTTLQS